VNDFYRQDCAAIEQSIAASKSPPIFGHTGQNFSVLLQVGWHVSSLFLAISIGFPTAQVAKNLETIFL